MKTRITMFAKHGDANISAAFEVEDLVWLALDKRDVKKLKKTKDLIPSRITYVAIGNDRGALHQPIGDE
jgi:hypothetical protein